MINDNDTELSNIHTFNIDDASREIYLHPYIDSLEEPSEATIDFRCAVNLEKNIRYLDSKSIEPILIHMHLPGGNWEDALGMYDCIKLCKSRVIILAYGKVESSSSIILQSAGLRILMPNTYVLIHYGSFGLTESDHPGTAISHAHWNEKELDKTLNIFTDKCMESQLVKEKKWKRLITKKHIAGQLRSKSDWILSAEEAVYYGFADGVLGTKKFPNIDYLKTFIKKQ